MITDAAPSFPGQGQLQVPERVPAELIRAAVLILDGEKAQPDVSRSIQSVLDGAASFGARCDAVARLFAPTQQPLAEAFATVGAFGEAGSKLLRRLRRLLSITEKLGLCIPMMVDEIIRSQDEAFGTCPAIGDRPSLGSADALDLAVAQSHSRKEPFAVSPKEDCTSTALSAASGVLDVSNARTASAGAIRGRRKSEGCGQVISSSPSLRVDQGTETGSGQPDRPANLDSDLHSSVAGSKCRVRSKPTNHVATHRGRHRESQRLQAHYSSRASATGSSDERREPSLFDGR